MRMFLVGAGWANYESEDREVPILEEKTVLYDENDDKHNLNGVRGMDILRGLTGVEATMPGAQQIRYHRPEGLKGGEGGGQLPQLKLGRIRLDDNASSGLRYRLIDNLLRAG